MIETKHTEPITYKIYECLKKHCVGKENAISGANLAAIFGISKRQLRKYIHKIRESAELSKVILACNKGYYIPRVEEGVRDINRLYSQAFSLLKAARASEKKAGLEGQYKIKLGEFYQDYVKAFGD